MGGGYVGVRPPGVGVAQVVPQPPGQLPLGQWYTSPAWQGGGVHIKTGGGVAVAGAGVAVGVGSAKGWQAAARPKPARPRAIRLSFRDNMRASYGCLIEAGARNRRPRVSPRGGVELGQLSAPAK